MPEYIAPTGASRVVRGQLHGISHFNECANCDQCDHRDPSEQNLRPDGSPFPVCLLYGSLLPQQILDGSLMKGLI
eukprot:CAMPEP_0194312972 /NCGR_PEP_ID=MMETSP0171-20130528/9870_1 /TAXON_ID=218684 /ORGANISM="Corethron pennatum, Strain L29A3" /LENGTH=74 /DNA_ID=CAMNT_0039067709 /DNA_START=14 /DNA_END=238 /DNA_ORIENTATION=+